MSFFPFQKREKSGLTQRQISLFEGVWGCVRTNYDSSRTRVKIQWGLSGRCRDSLVLVSVSLVLGVLLLGPCSLDG